VLLSMTGHGEAGGQNDRLAVTAEVRSVNNRHLKISVRCPDPFLALEANIDRLVRGMISRGTVTVALRVRHLGDHLAYGIDPASARRYWNQLHQIAESVGAAPPSDIGALLDLPGIVEETPEKAVREADWPLLEEVIANALKNLNEFRHLEGAVMAEELSSLCTTVEEHCEQIAKRAPNVLHDYRERLKNRVNELLQTTSVRVDDDNLIRELGLFADRCDITEELTRLRSHMQQYRKLLASGPSSGRKLDFLGQELFREVNTIGSKANDVEISHRVVEMKAAVEKMREIVQNVE
jgi:uncharacterized protein (TIGR00255 family)